MLLSRKGVRLQGVRMLIARVGVRFMLTQHVLEYVFRFLFYRTWRVVAPNLNLS